MRRSLKVLIAAAAATVAGWIAAPMFAGPAGSSRAAYALADAPVSEAGRIDYAALDRDLTTLAARPEMAGLAVAVVEDGKLRFVRTYGVTDRETGAPVTARTVFRWASVSKTATGLLAADLAKQGALDLDRPVASWPNSLRLPGGAETRLALAQLLSHQTGLTKNAYDEKLEANEAPEAIRAQLAMAPLQCPPGTCHTYQNVAFDAAAEILGRAAREPFAEAVEEHLFNPLGMTSARYGMQGLTGARDWARPHRNGQVRPLKPAYWRVPAAAGVESDIIDFATWMQAMMGAFPGIVSPAVLQTAHAPRARTPRLYNGDLARALSNATYGLGWRSFTYEGRSLAGHSGAVDGYRATMIFEPATRTGVVALWNSDWGRPFRIPFAVLDSYHKRTDSRWLDLSDLPPQTGTPAPPDTAH